METLYYSPTTLPSSLSYATSSTHSPAPPQELCRHQKKHNPELKPRFPHARKSCWSDLCCPRRPLPPPPQRLVQVAAAPPMRPLPTSGEKLETLYECTQVLLGELPAPAAIGLSQNGLRRVLFNEEPERNATQPLPVIVK